MCATALGLTPASASAGPARYVYEICDPALPGGGVGGVSYSTSAFGAALFSGTNSCSQPGGALTIARTNESGVGLGSAFFWHLRNANSSGATDLLAEFASGGQTPVVGDWNGDGTVTPGTYEPISGIWRLRNANSSGRADVIVQYGGSQFKPVVGDWDGNGTTTIGLFEPTAGKWHLRNSNLPGNPELDIQYGGSQFKPVAGDWDGNGTTTIGLFEPTAGKWHLRNANTPGNPDLDIQYGGSQFKPIVGDWDGNGTTTIGLYEPTQGRWELRNANTGGNPNLDFTYGDPQAFPITGDWNGDGSDTIGWVAAGSTTDIQGRGVWALPIVPPPGGTMASVTVSGTACRTTGLTIGFVLTEDWPLNCQPEQTRSFPLGDVAALPPSYAGFIWLECEGGESGESNQGCVGASISARYIAVTETDPVPPSLADLQGSLLSGNVIRGRHNLGASAHDVGGGLSNVWVSINGTGVPQVSPIACNTATASNASVIGTVAYTVTPCPTDVKASWSLNTQAFPFHNGPNTVRVCASDFSTLNEPNTTCLPAQSIDVDNSCAESTVRGGEHLSARFTRSKSDAITVRGKGARIVGRLTNRAGRPLRGATLCVKSSVLGVRGAPASQATVKTNAAGRYSYMVPKGPNREIAIGYRHDTNQITRKAHLYSRGRPILRATPRRLRNHKTVRFRGRLAGPSSGGRVVVIQARSSSPRRWITFQRATTNAKGVFRSAYRFESTMRTTTYRFRALVPQQIGYPWLEGGGRPINVKVRAAPGG